MHQSTKRKCKARQLAICHPPRPEKRVTELGEKAEFRCETIVTEGRAPMQVAKGLVNVMKVPMIRVGVYDPAAALNTKLVHAKLMQTVDVRRPSLQTARMCIAHPIRHYSTPPSKLPVPVIEPGENEQPLIYNRPQQRRRKPWYTSPVVYVLMIVPIFTFWLGNWQLRRLQWKLDLIEELEEKLNSKPLHLPRHINLEVLEEFAFRLVSLKGRFDPSRILFLGPRAREGERGYDLVMPFQRTEGGGDVLVNCGFVSNAFVEGTNMDKHLKHPLSFPGEVTLTTLLPRVYPPSRFALPNEPNNNLWMQVNPAQMAAWLNEQSGAAHNTTSEHEANRGFSPRDLWPFSKPSEPLSPSKAFQQKSNQVLPVYLEQVFDGTFSEAGARIRQGIPVGRPPKINLRNQHMEYAVTWFTLSGISSLMFIYMVSRGRGV